MPNLTGSLDQTLIDVGLALACGLLDEYYAPFQRLVLLNAIAIYSMAAAGSRDAALLQSAADFIACLTARDFPAAYAEAIALQRLQVQV